MAHELSVSLFAQAFSASCLFASESKQCRPLSVRSCFQGSLPPAPPLSSANRVTL